MKQEIKTEKLLVAYRILSAAKCSKMEDADKIKVWKIQRAMKPVAEQFDDDIRTAGETLKPEGYDDALQKALTLEQKEKKAFGELTQRNEREFVAMLSEKNEDYSKFQQMHTKYRKLVDDAVKEYADKEATLEYEPLSEDAFAAFVSSNDWTLEKISLIADYIVK